MKLKSFFLGIIAMMACSVLSVSCSDDDDDVAPEEPVTPEKPVKPDPLTFKFETKDIYAYGFEVMVTPSDDKQPYYADLVPADDFKDMTDDEIFQKYTKVLRWDDMLYGKHTLVTGKTLEPETTYYLLTFGIYKHAPSTGLTRYEITTTEEVGPTIELTPSLQDDSYRLLVKCTSKDATFGAMLGMESSEYDQLFGELGSDYNIFVQMFDYSTFFNNEWLDIMNSDEGLPLDLGMALYDKDMVCLLNTANYDNVHTYSKAVIEGPKRDNPHSGYIDAKMKASAPEAYKAELEIKCSTQNVDEANLIIFKGNDIDGYIENDGDLAELMDNFRSQATPFAPSWIEAINSKEGCKKILESFALTPNERWSILVELKNTDNTNVLRSDVIFTDEACVKHITQDEFRDLIWDYTQPWQFKGSKPCMIDFFATWCGPCMAMTPIIDAVAHAYSGKCDFYAIDVDQAQQAYNAFRDITDKGESIPFFAFIDVQGNITWHTGAMSENSLRNKIDGIINSEAAASAHVGSSMPAPIKIDVNSGKNRVNMLDVDKFVNFIAKKRIVKLPGHFLK